MNLKFHCNLLECWKTYFLNIDCTNIFEIHSEMDLKYFETYINKMLIVAPKYVEVCFVSSSPTPFRLVIFIL